MVDSMEKNHAGDLPSYAGPSDNFIQTKLRESKSKVGKLVLFNLFVCPLLFATVLLSLWGNVKYEGLSFPADICYLLKNVNGHLVTSFLMLCALSYALELLLLFAIATDNIQFCRTYLTTIAPLLWTFIILTFNVVMWSGLKPLENDTFVQFLIFSGSSTILATNFLSYLIKSLSEHTNFLSILTLIRECKISIEYV